MAEGGGHFSDEISHLYAISEPNISTLSLRTDTLAVGEPQEPMSENSPYVPTWRSDADLNSSPQPAAARPPPATFKVASMITMFFCYCTCFKSRKIEPTGIRPGDVKCDENQLPIVYNKQYDIHGIKNLGLPNQPILLNKPARVFSAIKGVAVAILIITK